MKPNELRTFLAAAIRERLNVLVTGAPGVGKSAIVEAAAQDVGAAVILDHPQVKDPTAAAGLPWVVQTEGGVGAAFIPFGCLAAAMAAEQPTVWFLDDLGQAPPSVQAAYMQLLLAREVNGNRLPDVVTFVAATNRRGDRAGVSGILEPVKSRFASIVELQPDVDDWVLWAREQDYISAEDIAFMRYRPELLFDFQPTADFTQSPTPRTWAHAARILSLGLPPEIEEQALIGAVGVAAATERLAFRRLWKELPSIDDIFLDPEHAKIPSQPGILYAIVEAVVERVTAETFPRVATYASRLIQAQRGEFAALLVRDSVRRDPNILRSKAFLKLAAGGGLGQIGIGGK
jgi:hypothetical protein